MFKETEEYFRVDSETKLNGDGQYTSQIIDKYGGTKARNRAQFLQAKSFQNKRERRAIKYLKDFSSSSKPAQARAYKLMADAYADSKNKESTGVLPESSSSFWRWKELAGLTVSLWQPSGAEEYEWCKDSYNTV